MRSAAIAQQNAESLHLTGRGHDMARKKIIITDIKPSGKKLTDEETRVIKGGRGKSGGGAGTSGTADIYGHTDTDADF
jgi:hypothetical protein